MHHLKTEEEHLLIWLWVNSPNGMGFCRSVIDGEPIHAPVWDCRTKTVSVRERDNESGEDFTTTFRGYLNDRVTSKHIKSLAYSKGYGGSLVKIYHGHEIDPKTGEVIRRRKPWQQVTIELTAEGRRWADSPYLRSQYKDHPSREDVKAAKAKADAVEEQQKTIERLREDIELLTRRLDSNDKE